MTTQGIAPLTFIVRHQNGRIAWPVFHLHADGQCTVVSTLGTRTIEFCMPSLDDAIAAYGDCMTRRDAITRQQARNA